MQDATTQWKPTTNAPIEPTFEDCCPWRWPLSPTGRKSYSFSMADDMVCIHMEGQLPAGLLGPSATTLDIRAYLVPHATGLALVDTGMDPVGSAIDAALKAAGAVWSDVSDILITHGHPDHTGALAHARASAPGAAVHASPLEMIGGADSLMDGQLVGSLRAFATSGHTPGHMSLFDEARGTLLVGDCLGVMDGQLVRPPAVFTDDAAQAEAALHRLLELRGARMLFAHGPEIERPWEALDNLLALT